MILTVHYARRRMHEIFEYDFPRAAVLSYHEHSPDMNYRPIARISPQRKFAPRGSTTLARTVRPYRETRNQQEVTYMQATLIRFARLRILSIVWVLVAGCAVQLAPNYDKALVTGLTAANNDVMVLFASVSAGTKPDSFPQREQKYNNAIGTLDALAIQAAARPVPKSVATDAVNKALQSRGIEPVSGDEIPSAVALRKISATVAKMRDTDRKQGVTAVEAQAFKNQAAILMDQALTYESYLER